MSADDIIKLLDQLAAKLSDPTQHVYDIAIKQMIIEGSFKGVLVVLLVLILPVILMRIARNFIRWNIADQAGERDWSRNDEDYELSRWAASWVARIGSGGFIFLGIVTLADAMNYLLNPEWQVLLKLIQLVPGTPK